mmetsp:Transcript_86108/g.139674  ORF Transcript_86108/g.139674 Transcript_86108/m.139674 type:complete len:213 (+) Transcript_86108:610-1248(+)
MLAPRLELANLVLNQAQLRLHLADEFLFITYLPLALGEEEHHLVAALDTGSRKELRRLTLFGLEYNALVFCWHVAKLGELFLEIQKRERAGKLDHHAISQLEVNNRHHLRTHFSSSILLNDSGLGRGRHLLAAVHVRAIPVLLFHLLRLNGLLLALFARKPLLLLFHLFDTLRGEHEHQFVATNHARSCHRLGILARLALEDKLLRRRHDTA